MTKALFEKMAALFFGEMAIARSQRSRVVMTSVRAIILSTADIFAQSNERFDRERFYLASGLDKDGMIPV
jgi:hypothetical protein